MTQGRILGITIFSVFLLSACLTRPLRAAEPSFDGAPRSPDRPVSGVNAASSVLHLSGRTT